MISDRSRRSHAKRLGAAALIVCAINLSSCTPPVASGAFRNTDALETRLNRGVSTKADVQAALGVPNGPGTWLLPALNPNPREIWYYEDMALAGTTMRMQMIFVFFKGNIYDGYLWSSGTSTADIKF